MKKFRGMLTAAVVFVLAVVAVGFLILGMDALLGSVR